jgi:type IV secretory pathway VirB2 component (pilin)
MKNIINKVLIIMLIIFAILNYIPCITNATIIDNVFNDGKAFLDTETDQTIKDRVDGVQIVSTAQQIYQILLTIGIIVAAIIIAVLGIQFMTGSIEQKAKVKEMLIPFIVGCIIVFGSLGIWQLVVKILSKI